MAVTGGSQHTQATLHELAGCRVYGSAAAVGGVMFARCLQLVNYKDCFRRYSYALISDLKGNVYCLSLILFKFWRVYYVEVIN
jgi:hypothetical protein